MTSAVEPLSVGVYVERLVRAGKPAYARSFLTLIIIGPVVPLWLSLFLFILTYNI